eukprot:1076526-Lingulodinium_polyedra.AAC.1
MAVHSDRRCRPRPDPGRDKGGCPRPGRRRGQGGSGLPAYVGGWRLQDGIAQVGREKGAGRRGLA